jgi:hypothetical protein
MTDPAPRSVISIIHAPIELLKAGKGLAAGHDHGKAAMDEGGYIGGLLDHRLAGTGSLFTIFVMGAMSGAIGGKRTLVGRKAKSDNQARRGLLTDPTCC